MAALYRKIYPIPMPEGAEIIVRRGQRLARWTDGNGKERTAPLSANGMKIMHEADAWYARYRDADGNEKRASTGCTDKQAAAQVLANLVAGVEKVRSGILTPEEGQAARHAPRPITEHVADYLAYLKTKTVRGRKISPVHRYNVERQLKRLVDECGFKRLNDISRNSVVRWLGDQTDSADKAPRTIQKYRSSLTSFCKWAVREGRLATNPLAELPNVEIHEDRRRRRALTLDEIAALLDAATRRPLHDALVIRRGKRKGQEAAKVRKSEQERFIRLGRERALIYKTLIYTGLRKNELATMTVGGVHLPSPGLRQAGLDGDQPYVALAAKNAKSARGAAIPLRADLAADLRAHLDEKLALARSRAVKNRHKEAPTALPADTPLFRVPEDLVRIFDRDLAYAGIAKEDADGRTVDVHSLRHTFATLLSKSGVVPRMAQELMRHSDIRLTMNAYTHLGLVDTAGAVEALPRI